MSETGTYGDVIDLAGIERNWPLGHDMPKLICDVAGLMAPWADGSFGHALFKSTRFDDYWVELGGDLNDQFGIFMGLPEGTNIALWFHEGAATNGEPVVEFGSEGELSVLAPNLKCFFALWADGQLSKNSVAYHELVSDEGLTPDERTQRLTLAAQLNAIVNAAPDHPPGAHVESIADFMMQWSAFARAKIADDPVMTAILTLLDAHIPKRPDGSDGETTYVSPTHYQIRIAGARVEIQPPALPPDYTTFMPLPERDTLIPLILQARDARAISHPGRGLWHNGMLELYEDRTAVLKASWEFAPDLREGGPMTKAEFEADLARFPKDKRWREPWMDDLT